MTERRRLWEPVLLPLGFKGTAPKHPHTHGPGRPNGTWTGDNLSERQRTRSKGSAVLSWCPRQDSNLRHQD